MLKFNDRTLKYLRWTTAASVTAATYLVFKASWIELNAPGTGEQSIYGVWAYRLIYFTVILIIPLWIHKIDSISSFFKDLDTIYGSDELAKNKAVRDTIKSMFIQGLPQIMVALVVAIFVYYIMITYVITPDLTQTYVDYHNLNYNNYTIFDHNISRSMVSLNITTGGK